MATKTAKQTPDTLYQCPEYAALDKEERELDAGIARLTKEREDLLQPAEDDAESTRVRSLAIARGEPVSDSPSLGKIEENLKELRDGRQKTSAQKNRVRAELCSKRFEEKKPEYIELLRDWEHAHEAELSAKANYEAWVAREGGAGWDVSRYPTPYADQVPMKRFFARFDLEGWRAWFARHGFNL